MRSISFRARHIGLAGPQRHLALLAKDEDGSVAVRGTSPHFVLWLAWVLVCTSRAVAADSTESSAILPRYKFEVGKNYKYEGSNHFKYDAGLEFHHETRWDVTVLGRNEDGTCRILFQYVDAENTKRTGAADTVNETVDYLCADVDGLGEARELWDSYGYRVDPSKVLLQLPADQDEMANHWQSLPGPFGDVHKCRKLAEGDDQHPAFDFVVDDPLSEIYGIESRGIATFDMERGVVEKFESWRKQTDVASGAGTETLKLTEVQERDAESCRALAADAEHFFKAYQRFFRVLKSDDATVAEVDQALEDLKLARAKLTTTEFQEQLDKKVEEFERSHAYDVQRINERLEMIGRPAEEFATTDLDEKPQALANYRGKVVLLDFWYRGCGWCILAMPQLRELAEHYRDRPVVLLGMNTDSKVEDAKFVVEKLKLETPNLKAEGLPERFKVHGFPTMILIDQEGIIRDVHTGWSPTLKDDFIAKIDRLLEKPK
jgi:thiol-disulfide isomerase/thioredoxin